MDNNNKSFDSYFSGKMSAKEALNFETALKADDKLRTDYDFYLSVKKATSEIQRDKLREQLDGINIDDPTSMNNLNGQLGLAGEKDLPTISENKNQKTSTKVYKLIKISIGIAALFIVGFWGYQTSQLPDNNDLFVQNFDIYTAKSARGANENALSVVYNEANYERFTIHADDIEHTPEIELMLANAYLVMDKVEFAISSLNKITDDSAFRDQKYWYLGLAHLKSGNLPMVKKQFNHLQTLSNYKKQEVEEILSKINN